MGMRVLLNLTDLNVPYQGVGLVTTQRVLTKKRDVARRFVRAYVDAIRMVKTNPDVSKRAYAKYRKAKGEKEVEPAYETLREVVKAKPYPSVEGFKTILLDLSERVPAAKHANPKDFIDVSLLEELDRGFYRCALALKFQSSGLKVELLESQVECLTSRHWGREEKRCTNSFFLAS